MSDGRAKKRPSFVQVIRNYRLLRYVKPYKNLLILMMVMIVLYSGGHFMRALLVKELLSEALWLPPEPEPAISIDDAIEKLPPTLRMSAAKIIQAEFRDSFRTVFTRQELKKMERSEVASKAEHLQEQDPSKVKFEKAIRSLTSNLGEKMAPGAMRRIYGQMGQLVLTKLEPQMPPEEAAKFKATVETAFAANTNDMNLWHIVALCGGLAAFSFVVAALVYARTFLKAKVVTGATYDIRRDLCHRLLHLDMRFFSNRSSGDMISRQTNDIVAGTKALTTLFDELAVEPFLVLAYLSFAVYVSWQLTLVFVTLFLVLPIPLARLARRIKKYGRQKLERIAELTTVMSEIYHGMRVTKAFHIEERKHKEFSDVNRRYVSRVFKALRLRGIYTSLTEGFINLALSIVMFIAALIINRNIFGIQLNPVDILTFGGAIVVMYSPAKTLIKAYPDFIEAAVASERVFEVLDIQPEIRDSSESIVLKPMQNGIAFRDVSFAYDNHLVLKNISFEVKRGQIIAVVGHSGAGKSTLLDLIPRFYDPVTGSVEIDGLDIRKATLASLRGQISVVSQDPFLFQTTISDNIRYGRLEATENEIVEAAQAANIHEFIMALPNQYETVCGERGVKLSGGQRQRITIARAILKNAPTLLLDEATSSLDTESERLVRDALQRLMQDRTTFVIAHRLSTVQHAHRIIVLREGELVESGTHPELIEAKGEYWRLYNTEFRDKQDA